MERTEGERPAFHAERRALARVAPETKIWAAVDNETRNELLGMAEVADFSGLGVALKGMSGDPVAAAGDTLWVTLISKEGLIPLRARLVRSTREGLYGVRIEVPDEAGQRFLIKLYDRAAREVAGRA
jgi:PilZ domain